MREPTVRMGEQAEYWRTIYALFRDALEVAPDPAADFMADAGLVDGEYGTYAQAVALLNNAFDSTDTLGILWSIPRAHVPSDYLLMRAVVDNALRTIWLLAPDDPRERTIRAWRHARDTPRRVKTRAEGMLREDPERATRQNLLAEVKNVKEHLKEIDDTFEPTIGRPRGLDIVRAEEFIREAEAQPLHAGRDGDIQRLWAQLSELAHGAAVPVKSRMLQHEPQGHIRPSHADPTDLVQAADIVTRVLEAALELFYTRRSY